MVYQNFSLRGERFSQQTDVFLEKKFSSQSKRKILAAKKKKKKNSQCKRKVITTKKTLTVKEKFSRKKKVSHDDKKFVRINVDENYNYLFEQISYKKFLTYKSDPPLLNAGSLVKSLWNLILKKCWTFLDLHDWEISHYP